ncbi:MAG TPA: hypothetical protein VLK22_02105 [Candidatus Udaeobacter sp.]|nr:hypothetical protein [Candidatus Udaeobacter sp.]
MFFILDNTDEEKMTLYFSLNNKLIQHSYPTTKNQNIAVCLEKSLAKLKLGLKDLKYLGVVVGEGRFTASRLAVTAINTLAYSLKVPAVALPKNFDQALAIKLAKKAAVGKYLVPQYSGEARVS